MSHSMLFQLLFLNFRNHCLALFWPYAVGPFRAEPFSSLSRFLDFLFVDNVWDWWFNFVEFFFGHTQSAFSGRSPFRSLSKSLDSCFFLGKLLTNRTYCYMFYRFYDVCIVCDIDFLISHFKTFLLKIF